jgi:hypothetical protein
LVPQARLERARPCEHQILSLARLPVPPLGLAQKPRIILAARPPSTRDGAVLGVKI